jgi:uncharacterized protein
MTQVVTMLWRRLDVPGHDACRLDLHGHGWSLAGTAVFRDAAGIARLDYEVATDAAWVTQRARVRGWIGVRRIDTPIERSRAGVWTCAGAVMPAVAGLHDVDFGFTPATNLLHLRRTALAVGAAADVPVAWLDAGDAELCPLPQRYERRSASTFWYESPTTSYAALLELAPNGFVAEYPGLWRAES